MASAGSITWRALRGVVAVVGLAGCNGPSHGVELPGQPTPAASERGVEALQGSWTLVELLEAGAAVTPVSEGTLIADFGADGDLFIQADCNVCSAGYDASADGAVEVIGSIPCTLAYCSIAPLDTRFLALLQSARSWSIGEVGLELSSAAGSLLFHPAAD
jgi:heat shock protein HslJ